MTLTGVGGLFVFRGNEWRRRRDAASAEADIRCATFPPRQVPTSMIPCTMPECSIGRKKSDATRNALRRCASTSRAWGKLWAWADAARAAGGRVEAGARCHKMDVLTGRFRTTPLELLTKGCRYDEATLAGI